MSVQVLINDDICTVSPVLDEKTAEEMINVLGTVFSGDEPLGILCGTKAEEEHSEYMKLIEAIMETNKRATTCLIAHNSAGKAIAGLICVGVHEMGDDETDIPVNMRKVYAFLDGLHEKSTPFLQNPNPKDQILLVALGIHPDYRSRGPLAGVMVDMSINAARDGGFKSCFVECSSNRSFHITTKGKVNTYVRASQSYKDYHGEEEKFGEINTDKKKWALTETAYLVEEILSGEGYKYQPEREVAGVKAYKAKL